MVTLPKEQVTQRNLRSDVSITFDNRYDSPGEKLWLITAGPTDETATKAVVSDQLNRKTLEDRIQTAGETKYKDFNIHDETGIGDTPVTQPLVVIGSDAVAVSMANSATTSRDIRPLVASSALPLHYEIDAAAEDDYVTSTLFGSVIQFVSGTGDGADTVPVNVTDSAGNTVTITFTVTVA